jgi:hypothetical protein
MTASLTGCGHDDDPPWAQLSWTTSALPVQQASRAMVRAATWCHGRWVVVGATADRNGRTRPAVWGSSDGRTWQTVDLHAGRDFYASRAILTSVACAHGRVAALGAKSGGAHGMPRTQTWQQRPDGSLAAVRAPYLLYGGTQSVAVARLVGGPDGYLIAGTRTSGAAVWRSVRGASFRLYDDAPGLADTQSTRTQASDALWYGDRWLVAGDTTLGSGRLTGSVWSGVPGGTWRRDDLPGGSTVSTADRLARTGGGPDAAGLLDQRFGLWELRGGRWSLRQTFGEHDADGTAAAYVSGLAFTGELVVATYSDGARFRLVVGELDESLPASVTVTGDHAVTVATHGSDLLLLTDDGSRGRVWLTRVPGPVS